MNEFRYQRVIQFDNGYGLSIVSNQFSYGGSEGLFEAALLNKKGKIVYVDELGFEDVVGFLDFADVVNLIEKVRNAPKISEE